MVTYLYCVLTSTGAKPPEIEGIGGAPVRALALDRTTSIEAWVGTVSEAAFRVSGRELGAQALVHNEVVAAAFATGRTPLPARFGSHFANDDACITALNARAVALRDNLTQVADSVEMSVLIVPPRAPAELTPPPERHERSAGRRYLERVRDRARRIEAADAIVDAVVANIGTAVRDLARSQSRARRSTGIVSIAHLLRREDVTRYREAVHAVATPTGVRLLVAGPRAPYSFVASGALSTGHDSSSPNVNA